MKRFLAAASMLAAVGVGPTPQSAIAGQHDPAFSIRSDAVRLDVRVLDEDGHFVRGLTGADFRIVDEGVVQQVAQAALIDRPPAHAVSARADIKADASSNRTSADGAVYAIVIDDLHIDPQRLETTKQIAHQFIEQYMEDGDRMAITTTSGLVGVAHEFSNDRASLLDAVDALGRVELDDNDGQAPTLAAIRRFVDFLSTIPERRKSVILISEGFRLASGWRDFNEGRAGGVVRDARSLLTASATANVSFYPIDPRGDPAAPYTTLRPAPDKRTRLSSPQREARRQLAVLAEETGGSALVESNRFAEAFERIVSDNSVYYLLGYAPAAGTPSPARHRISVSVTRPGMTVYSRRGYAGPDAKPSPRGAAPKGVDKDLGECLQSPLPLPGLPLAVTAAAFSGRGDKAAVTVTLDVGDSSEGDVDVLVAVADDLGTHVSEDHRQARVSLRAEDGAREAPRGRFATTLMLKPGRYHLRAAAIRHDKSARGSVLHDFTVPDFRNNALVLSQVLIASDRDHPATAERGATVDDAAATSGDAQPPTARRVFAASESLHLSADVYGTSTHAKPLTARVFVSSADGGVVRRSDPGAATLPAGKHERVPLRLVLPLAGVEPGAYILDLEVRGPAAAETIVRRVPIRVQ